ncbi:hypothetical protein Shyd_71880 [Streptomyces hydrogenans]|uniref:Uncharacterized protein n=1 Tax=Streptomyces hydrogenans TaxID=1873719 RepID=A0ABQ3PD03_9ACTN|nr:hypothetical protein GCM10018784_35750 [Streptomyces hydrogenans]GHI20305.1 hypothetical protein Shyd_16760 [Streptomyces hydrogenans]GHI22906.1 hypothetical protein Shyd_42770 [Streptomyces hydrogenans]GHI24361.1 hypothetical protein Shyd_57320 [Streptomyces hydrogenans]GHI25745.1 hypothetical protein Shyd_71160 [Streptomyces hydrogenans]
MGKPPQLWHGVARKGLLQRKQVPPALVRSRRVTRVSALPQRTQNASWAVMVPVYLRFATSVPLLRASGTSTMQESRNGAAPWCSSPRLARPRAVRKKKNTSPAPTGEVSAARSTDPRPLACADAGPTR